MDDRRKKNDFLDNRKEKETKESFFLKIYHFISPKKNPLFLLVLIGFFLNLAGGFLLYNFIEPSDYGIILHYNSFLGIDELVNLRENYYRLFIPSMAGMAIIIINTILAVMMSWQNKNLKDKGNKNTLIVRRISFYFLLSSSILVQLVILVYILAVIRVNG